MALIRVAQYNSTPTLVTDYQAQNAHLQAFTNQLMTQQFILDSGTAKPVIKQGTYVSHGGSLYIADADTAITGSPADGSVYIRVSGTTSLTVEFVTDISGYAWNPVYSALTSGSYTLLPYLIVKVKKLFAPDVYWFTCWTRYNFNPNNQQFGALASLTVDGNTSIGGTLGVAGAISGASVDTGQGATEVYLMNQNVRTTDSPTFAKLTLTMSAYGSRSIGSEGTWVVPVGIYQMVQPGSAQYLYIEVYNGSVWTRGHYVGAVISDGSNVRIYNSHTSSSIIIHYRKFS